LRAVFLDRDGVINDDFGYVSKIEDFKFKEGIFELLELLQNEGFTLFVITNQSGIARGYYTKEDFLKLTDFMLKELEKRDIFIKEVAYCPCHPDFSQVCDCRKPSPKMILDLAKKYSINLKESILIGDKQSDIEAGKNAGLIKNYLVKNSIFDIISQIHSDLKG